MGQACIILLGRYGLFVPHLAFDGDKDSWYTSNGGYSVPCPLLAEMRRCFRMASGMRRMTAPAGGIVRIFDQSSYEAGMILEYSFTNW